MKRKSVRALYATLGAVVVSVGMTQLTQIPSAMAASGPVITTVAGNGSFSSSPEGSIATHVGIGPSTSVTTDRFGNIYIGENDNRVHKIDTHGIITTYAGNGTAGFSGDGGVATHAELAGVSSLAMDNTGDLYIADADNSRIREVNAQGTITTVAGDGTFGFSGDGTPAASAKINNPNSVAVDAAGNVFIADTNNNRIREIKTNGIISTIAGNGTEGFTGDTGPATHAELSNPTGVAVDRQGNVYFVDQGVRVRKVNMASGTISTFAGSGFGHGVGGFSGDGGLATSAGFADGTGLAFDSVGNLYISTGNDRIRKVDTHGIITTVAGNGIEGYSGDGSAATAAELNTPIDVAVDAADNLYISDYSNNRLRKVTFNTAANGQLQNRLLVSNSNDRSGPIALGGTTETAAIFLFVNAPSGSKVTFSLDGVQQLVETHAPYDFAGTASSGKANPLQTDTLTPGTHTLAVSIKLSNGTTVTDSAPFTGASPALLISAQANRSNPHTLGGVTINSNQYVFLADTGNIASVTFSLDAHQQIVETQAPFDFAGTASNGNANPFNFSSVTSGAHTIYAVIHFKDGQSHITNGTFITTSSSAIDLRYATDAGLRDQLGTSTGPEKTVGAGREHPYQWGTLYWSPSTGVHEVRGAIRARYQQLGGAAGFLGFPTTDEGHVYIKYDVPDEQLGARSDFTGGAIYWYSDSNTTAWISKPFANYLPYGTYPYFGAPTRDEYAGKDGARIVAADGLLYSTSTGFYVMNTGYPGGSNDIVREYQALGADGGVLGLPTSNQADVTDGHGQDGIAMDFQSGRIYQCGYDVGECDIPQSHAVHGAIQWYFDHHGGLSTIGYPTSDEQAATGGRIEHFQHGSLFWNATTNAVTFTHS